MQKARLCQRLCMDVLWNFQFSQSKQKFTFVPHLSTPSRLFHSQTLFLITEIPCFQTLNFYDFKKPILYFTFLIISNKHFFLPALLAISQKIYTVQR